MCSRKNGKQVKKPACETASDLSSDLLFVLAAIILQDAQLQDGQRIQWSLVFAAKAAETPLLWLLANDQLINAATKRSKMQ